VTVQLAARCVRSRRVSNVHSTSNTLSQNAPPAELGYVATRKAARANEVEGHVTGDVLQI